MKFHPLKLVLFATTLAFIAASPAPTANPEDMLKTAGFQARKAKTDAEKQELKKLPDRKICEVKQNGKRYYVYPDRRHNQVYVGNEDKHKRLRSGLKQGANGDAITRNMYDDRGNPFQVNDFSGFGPWPPD